MRFHTPCFYLALAIIFRFGVDDTAIASEGEVLNAAPPDGGGQRLEEFARRDDPENLKRLAAQLCGLLDLDRDPLRAIRQTCEDGQTRQTLEQFRSYFLAQTRDFDWGIAEHSLESRQYDPERAADLLDNIVEYRDGTRVRLGEPGAIDWAYQLPKPGNPWAASGYDETLYYLDVFDDLIRGFIESGDRAFLNKWSAFVDDWALHQTGGLNQFGPYDVPATNAFAVRHYLQFIRLLERLAVALPADGSGLSAPTLARVMVKYTRETIPLSVEFMRTNAQNWSVILYANMIQLGFLLEDFKIGPTCLREGRRRFEEYASIINLRDGTEIQPDPWYMWTYLDWSRPAYTLLEGERPEWATSAWFEEQDENMAQRARYLPHSIFPNREYPVGLRTDKRDRFPNTEKRLQDFPRILEEPAIARILSVLSGRRDLPLPDFTAEWYPYAGYYHLRTGWEADDPYAVMFCAPEPGSGRFRSQPNNNGVYLYAWGQDLLLSGAVYAYNYTKSPVLVDGKSQNFYVGFAPDGEHRVRATAWFEPADFRWHSSDRFTVAEGEYDGPYSIPFRHAPDFYSPENLLKTQRQALYDVGHHRSLHTVRGHDMWIVTDRMISEGEHTYRQDWRLPSPLHEDQQAYEPEQVEIDASAGSFKTQAEGMVNLAIYQVGQRSMQLHSQVEAAHEGPDATNRSFVNFHRLSTSWRGSDHSQLITILYPRRNIEDDLVALRELEDRAGVPIGFEARLTDGATISYIAAPDKLDTLRLGDLTVLGESLLLVTEPGGERHGVALGAREMGFGPTRTYGPGFPGWLQRMQDRRRAGLGARKLFLQDEDFEFEIRGAALVQTAAIHRPIRPVRIYPERNVFTGVQEISMGSATLGVEIRYTTDGSDPTAQSTLHTVPFTITGSTTVKARAFRPGVRKIPSTMEGTLVSVVTRATFTRQEPLAAADPGQLERGMSYRYYEGDWKDLFLSTSDLSPLREEDVDELFDLTPRCDGASSPYAFSYSGYIEVPEEGVYTFHAPDEWVTRIPNPGYELQLWVGDRQWYPATRIHAVGKWSLALRAGKHRFRVHFADIRPGGRWRLWQHMMPQNPEGFDSKQVWDGAAPRLLVSGPGIDPQPVPAEWLWHE